MSRVLVTRHAGHVALFTPARAGAGWAWLIATGGPTERSYAPTLAEALTVAVNECDRLTGRSTNVALGHRKGSDQ